MEEAGGFTVADVLELDAMSGSTVVSGRAGLARRVTHVAVLDLSDLEAVRPGQLVISNAYPLLRTDLAALVRRLDLRGASGLGLKLSTYWAEVPEPLRRGSERHGLPVIVLPEGPFDEIVNPVLATIVERQVATLRGLARVHNDLTMAALRADADPQALVRIVTEAVGRPAALFGEAGLPIASTGDGSTWRSEQLARRVAGASQAGLVRVGADRYFIAPVPGRPAGGGAVCVHDLSPDDGFAVAAVAHAALVAGMLLVGRRQVEEIHRRFERELLEDLVEGRMSGPGPVRDRIEAIGWPLGSPFVALAVGNLEAGPSVEGSRDDPSSLARTVADATDRAVRAFARRPGVGIVIHLREDDDPRDAAAAARAGIDGTAGGGPSGGPVRRIGVSAAWRDALRLQDAFREAALAFELGPPGRPTVHVHDIGPAQLLARAGDRDRLRARADAILGPLGDDAVPRRRDLLDTAAVMLSHNLRLSSTARQMYFHYNTVRHRVARLQQLLGGRLWDPDGRLSLSVAVAAVRLVDAEGRLGLRPTTDGAGDHVAVNDRRHPPL